MKVWIRLIIAGDTKLPEKPLVDLSDWYQAVRIADELWAILESMTVLCYVMLCYVMLCYVMLYYKQIA
jgi:hypothetical protein